MSPSPFLSRRLGFALAITSGLIITLLVMANGIGLSGLVHPVRGEVAAAGTSSSGVAAEQKPRKGAIEHYGQWPLAFEANVGQTNSQVKFFARGNGYNLFLTPRESVLTLRKDDGRESVRRNEAIKSKVEGKRARASHHLLSSLRMKLAGALSSII